MCPSVNFAKADPISMTEKRQLKLEPLRSSRSTQPVEPYDAQAPHGKHSANGALLYMVPVPFQELTVGRPRSPHTLDPNCHPAPKIPSRMAARRSNLLPRWSASSAYLRRIRRRPLQSFRPTDPCPPPGETSWNHNTGFPRRRCRVSTW